MSRGQSSTAFNTASGQNATDFSNAQSAFGDTENSIGNYNNQLAKFVSSNPYTPGGEYDQTVNTGLANVSDAGANSLKGALASTALRTGQNSASNAATAASAAQQNTRDLSSSLASAEQQRIGSEAGYNQTALGATATPISANQSLYGTSTGASGSALGTEEGAAQAPSFWDEVGQGLAGIPSAAAGNVNYSNGNIGYGNAKGCWIAAELYGGWDDPRVHLLRSWIFGPFSDTVHGSILAEIYARYGERMAAFIRRNRGARLLAKALFDRALKYAGKG